MFTLWDANFRTIGDLKVIPDLHPTNGTPFNALHHNSQIEEFQCTYFSFKKLSEVIIVILDSLTSKSPVP